MDGRPLQRLVEQPRLAGQTHLLHVEHLEFLVEAGRVEARAIIDFGKRPHGAGGVDRNVRRNALPFLESVNERKDFLRAPERERGNKRRAAPLQHLRQGVAEFLFLCLARGLFGRLVGSQRGFEDQYIYGRVRIFSARNNGLRMPIGVARVERPPGSSIDFPGKKDARGAQHVSGMVKPGRDPALAAKSGYVEIGVEVAGSVHELLLFQFLFAKQGRMNRRAFLKFALLQARGGGKHEIRQIARSPGHMDAHMREMLDQHGQRTDVVVVRMRNQRMVHVPVGPLVDRGEIRQRVRPFFVGVGPRVDEEARIADQRKVTAGADGFCFPKRNKLHSVPAVTPMRLLRIPASRRGTAPGRCL